MVNLCENLNVSENEPTIEELEKVIVDLRAEVQRLQEQLRLARRQDAEIPPHYL
jgi:uncharacterized coiled-coil protein SlyX